MEVCKPGSHAARVALPVLLGLLLLLPQSALAQSGPRRLCGRVVDADGPLPEVIVTLLGGRDEEMVAYSVTDPEGRFCLEGLPRTLPDRLTIRVAAMSYRTFTLRLSPDRLRDPRPLADIVLEAAPVMLKEVVSRAPAITARRDTINYNAELLRRKEDHSVEDLLRRLPGIEFSSDGIIKYLGRPISRVMIEDLDMLGGQYRLATRNISPDMVAQVQIYEHDQPIKVRRNLERSESAAINLKLKEEAKVRPILYAETKAGTGCRPLLYEGQLFRLQVGRRRQNLEVAKADNSGHNVGEDFVPLFFGGSAPPRPDMKQLVTRSSMGEAPLPRSYYDYNRDLAASANAITRLGKGEDNLLTLGLTLSDTHRDTYGRQSTRYSIGQGEVVDVNEADHARTRERSALLRLKYERNLESLYLMEELVAGWARQSGRHDLEASSPLEMTSRYDEWYLSNKLLRTRRRDDNLYTLSSDIYVGGIPCSQLSVTSAAGADDLRSQQLSGLALRTDHKYELRLALPHHWSLELSPGLAVDMDRLYTLYSDRGKESINDLTLTRMRPYLLLKWRWEYAMGESVLETPIIGEYTHLDRVGTSGVRSLRWMPYLALKHTHRWSALWSISLGGRLERQSGELLRYLTSPVMTSYRSLSSVDASTDPEQWSYSASLSTRYRDPIEARSAHAIISYIGSRQSLLSTQEIGEDFSRQHYVAGVSRRHFINSSMGFSIGLDDRLESVLSVDVAAMMGRNSVVRNDRPLTITSQSVSISPTYRYTPSEGLMSGWLMLGYSASRFHLSMKDGPVTDAEEIPQELTVRGGVTLRPGAWQITAGLHGRGLWSNLRPFTMVPIGDLSIRYCRRSGAPEYTASLRNVFNRTDYRTESFAGADYTAHSYRLRGREVLVGVRWSF